MNYYYQQILILNEFIIHKFLKHFNFLVKILLQKYI